MSASFADGNSTDLRFQIAFSEIGCLQQRVPLKPPIVIVQQTKDFWGWCRYDLADSAGG